MARSGLKEEPSEAQRGGGRCFSAMSVSRLQGPLAPLRVLRDFAFLLLHRVEELEESVGGPRRGCALGLEAPGASAPAFSPLMVPATLSPPNADAAWRTIRIRVPQLEIAYLCAVFEGYDNLALVRTQSRAEGILHLWFHESAEAAVETLLAELGASFPISILERSAGMSGLDEVIPDESH